MDTNKIAKRVAQAHLQKQAGRMDLFFELVDKKKWRGIMDALRKAGDQASVDLWFEASEKISDQLQMDRNTEMALNKMRNLMVKSNWNDPKAQALLRNQVFKIADLLGIRLPHAIFASDKTAKNHRVGLPPYGSWRDFVNFVQLREMQNSTTPQTNIDLKHALREIQNYAAHDPQSARDLKAAAGAIIDAQNIHHQQAKLAREFDAAMVAIHKALKKAGQL
jgi:hypothetical protein